ncbi:2-keto-4-pentenoate hydratase [Psychrobacillus sp. FJAT-51614]|uniref:2-keto-4-pentenoate hydratase n=1 Tax=Psychrobacillus mangrovi TaxID=3117745 RepID=A0ABU8F9U3_9BACI
MNIVAAAEALLQAEKEKKTIAPFTSSIEAISIEDAYQIQIYQIEKKVEQGAVIKGKKIGLTSKVMQEMFNVSTPDYGHILDNMIFDEGSSIHINRFIQPKVEFEIAFVLNKDLQGPNITADDVIAATEYVVPAIEIIDSRIENWKFKFEDTVADNGSSAGAVIGKRRTKIDNVDLVNEKLSVYKNDELIDGAKGEAVLGNPVNAVAWLANTLAEYNISLKKGEIILAGALTKALTFEPGDTFTAIFETLGDVTISFTGGVEAS